MVSSRPVTGTLWERGCGKGACFIKRYGHRLHNIMFMKTIFIMTFIFILTKEATAQAIDAAPVTNGETYKETLDFQHFHKSVNGSINVFIFTRERKKKIDLLAFYTLLRARVKSLFHHKKFYVINARSAKDACAKMEQHLHKEKKFIKNIWFDSHGHYGNRYSSFLIGTDQFSYKNICDSNATRYLRLIAKYCDDHTRIGIGSCYAGADFYFPATDSTPATRMNGDSLMIGLGHIFSHSSIYASESWVMAKPGIFKNRFGFAGYPLNRKFKDNVYAPVWERLGKWKQYSFITGSILDVPTIALDNLGNIHLNKAYYHNRKKTKNKIAKVSRQFRGGLAHFS
jgi:hypothetical protein